MGNEEEKFWNASPFDSLDHLELGLLKEEKFDFCLKEAGLEDNLNDNFYRCILTNWKDRYEMNYLDPKTYNATIEKVEEIRFTELINKKNFGFKLHPNLHNPFDYDYFMISNDRKKINFCEGKHQTNTLMVKNIWDIHAMNFLSLNEYQVLEYGAAEDLDYLIFDRDVNVNEYKNKKVLPYIKRLNWLIGEEDFVSKRELVVLNFKLFFKSYERNESIIRLEIPESKNPSWNDPTKRQTVCFSSDEFFCKKYDLPQKENG